MAHTEVWSFSFWPTLLAPLCHNWNLISSCGIFTFPHEFSLALAKQFLWHLLIAGLRDLAHFIEGAVFHNICQLLIIQLFSQEQGDPLHYWLQILTHSGIKDLWQGPQQNTRKWNDCSSYLNHFFISDEQWVHIILLWVPSLNVLKPAASKNCNKQHILS